MPSLARSSPAVRQETQASFFAAAERLMDGGASYAEISIERISGEAGLSRTAFYFYFRDKRDFLMKMSDHVAVDLYAAAERWWTADPSGADSLRPALNGVFSIFREHRSVLRAIVEAAAYDEAMGAFWRELIGRFVAATRERLERDGVDDAPALAYALVWMTERLCYQQLVDERAPETGELIDAAAAVFERSVRG